MATMRVFRALGIEPRAIHSTILVAAALVTTTAVATAGWSDDPATNTPVADAASDQVQPKLAVSADGGTFVSWFDGIANGYDVRVQKLDGEGDERFSHDGVLVADRGFSSTQDYGLSTLGFGDAVLAFRDDRFSGTQITASRIASSGATLWGPNGVQLTQTTDFVAAPAVAATSDGSVVVAWTQGSSARVMRLDGFGVPAWPSDIVLTPPSGSYSLNDIRAVGEAVIVSLTHETGGFGSPRRLHAQKIAADGSLPWGPTPVSVFTTGSLQFGNFPDFSTNDAGESFFSWYDASTLALQCYVQRLDAGGAPAFGANGAPVSTDVSRVRVGPSAAYDPITDEITVFWTELNAAQSQFGLHGQRFDASGNRLWPSEGIVVVALGPQEISQVSTVIVPEIAFRGHATPRAGEQDRPFVFWSQAPSFGNQVLRGAKFHTDGQLEVPPFFVSSTPSGKSRLAAVRHEAGQAVLAWSDDRRDDGDVLAQNVNFDGSLGLLSVSAPEGNDTVGSFAPWPNPARRVVHIPFSDDGSNSVEIQDVRGRRILHLEVTRGSGLSGSLVWDGRGSDGVSVPPGIYYVRTLGGRTAPRAITWLP